MSVFYTDGSAHPNPGPGGYGIVEIENEKVISCYSRQYEDTTNNRMELESILYVMKNFGASIFDDFFQPPTVYSDSAYAVNALNDWVWNWAKNGWRKSDNSEPENLDLFKNYLILYNKGLRIDLKKVQGHNNILGNELADKLATNTLTCDEVFYKYG